MIIKLLIDGGDMKPGPAIAQKIGPLGINMGKVIQKVNESTKDFKGLRVPVELDINTKTKNFEIKVFSPPTAELIKKELGIEKASGEHKKIKVGNLAIEHVIKIAKIKYPNMLARNLKKAVLSVTGSCVSLGVLIENQESKKVCEQIISGKYDSEIKEEKSEADQEKLEKLKNYFNDLKKKQEEIIKKEEEAKAAEEAAKTQEEAEKKPKAEEEKKEEVKKEKAKEEKSNFINPQQFLNRVGLQFVS